LYETILLEQKEAIGIITLNRPKKLNALNRKVVSEMGTAIKEFRDSTGIKAVIITGGEKVFGAGADIDEISQLSVFDSYLYSKDIHHLFLEIENLPKPVIAAIGGIALGGCLELALSCDVRLASEKAKLGVPEINLGLLPGAGGTQRLPRLVNSGWAKWMLFSGQPISANEAYQIGLVQKVVPEGEVLNEALKIAADFANKPGLALATIKDLVNTGMGLELPSALKYESRGFGMLFSTEDMHEGTKAFMEKRKPQFRNR